MAAICHHNPSNLISVSTTAANRISTFTIASKPAAMSIFLVNNNPLLATWEANNDHLPLAFSSASKFKLSAAINSGIR
ncbi:MAG TPA: hypothetical protein DIT31_07350 [Methylophaga sp.]|nr:hypothetical protein [Methylophaga sp.]